MSELRKVPDGIPGTLCRSFSLVQDDERVGFEQFREFCGSLAEDLSAAGKLSWVFMAAKMEHAGVELRAASRFIPAISLAGVALHFAVCFSGFSFACIGRRVLTMQRRILDKRVWTGFQMLPACRFDCTTLRGALSVSWISLLHVLFCEPGVRCTCGCLCQPLAPLVGGLDSRARGGL